MFADARGFFAAQTSVCVVFAGESHERAVVTGKSKVHGLKSMLLRAVVLGEHATQ